MGSTFRIRLYWWSSPRSWRRGLVGAGCTATGGFEIGETGAMLGAGRETIDFHVTKPTTRARARMLAARYGIPRVTADQCGTIPPASGGFEAEALCSVRFRNG